MANNKRVLTAEELDAANGRAITVMEKYEGEQFPMELDSLDDLGTVASIGGIPVPVVEYTEKNKLVYLGAIGNDPYKLDPVATTRSTKKTLKELGAPAEFKIAGTKVNVY